MYRKNIISNLTLEKYKKKYRNCKYKLLKFTKKQVEDFDKQHDYFKCNKETYRLGYNNYLLKGRKWALIDDTYYEIPRAPRFIWFINLSVGVQAAICLLGASAVTSAVAVPLIILNQNKDINPKAIITYNINWKIKQFDLLSDGNPRTLFEFAKEATKIEFIKSDVTTDGVLVGDTLNDLIYGKFKVNDDGTKILTIWSSGKISFDDEDCRGYGDEGLFKECRLVTSFDFSNVDTSKITNFHRCFNYCESVTDLNLSSFDTSNAVDMGAFFLLCKKLKNLTLPNNFVTSKVTNLGGMFYGCESFTSLDLSNFDTSKVENMDMMFKSCKGLTSLDLSNFNTSNVINFEEMFCECTELKTIRTKRNFDTSKAERTSGIFCECEKIVGGKGTTFIGDDCKYACIDQGRDSQSPGYFTESK